jgi:hypothetical protein
VLINYADLELAVAESATGAAAAAAATAAAAAAATAEPVGPADGSEAPTTARLLGGEAGGPATVTDPRVRAANVAVARTKSEAAAAKALASLSTPDGL